MNLENNVLLLKAVGNCNLDVLVELLNQNADIETKDDNGYTPLMCAIKQVLTSFSVKVKGKKEFIIEYLKSSPHLEAINECGETPLTCTKDSGSWMVVSINKKRAIDVVSTLLNRNANIETKNKYEETPLHLASNNGHYDIVEELLNHNANINAENMFDNTPLHLASKNGHYDIVKELLKRNANIEATNNEDNTPLHLASENGHYDIVEELLNHNANINAGNMFDKTPLHIVSDTASFDSNYKNITILLLNRNGNIEAIDENGYTPLHCASYAGNFGIIQELIEHGADINAIDNNDYTPYDIAVSQCYTDTILELLDSKDNIVESTSDYMNKLVRRITCSKCNINEIKVALGCGHMICKSCSKKLSKCNICDYSYISNKIRLEF